MKTIWRHDSTGLLVKLLYRDEETMKVVVEVYGGEDDGRQFFCESEATLTPVKEG